MITAASKLDPCSPECCRSVNVAFLGELMVPKHITRIENSRSAGWQVRFTRPSRFFSDAVSGGPEASLDAAKNHLRAIYLPPTLPASSGGSARASEPQHRKVSRALTQGYREQHVQ
ncbi:MAG: hypothetical protein ACRER5_22880 [Pseudomonas sp.]